MNTTEKLWGGSKRGYRSICKRVWLMSRITSETRTDLHMHERPAVHGQRTDGRGVALVQEVTMFCIIIICSVVSSLLLCWTTCFTH